MVKYFLRLLIIAIFSLIPTSEIFSTAQPDSVDADKLYQKAGDYWRDVKFDSSNYYYEKAAAIFKENKNWQRYIDCQNNIGINSRYLGKYSDAISHLENGLDAAGNLNEKQDSVRSELYNNIGLVYYEKEYYDKAYKYYRDMLELNEKTFGTKNTK